MCLLTHDMTSHRSASAGAPVVAVAAELVAEVHQVDVVAAEPVGEVHHVDVVAAELVGEVHHVDVVAVELVGEVHHVDADAAEVAGLGELHSAAAVGDAAEPAVEIPSADAAACPCAWRWDVVDCTLNMLPFVCIEHSCGSS